MRHEPDALGEPLDNILPVFHTRITHFPFSVSNRSAQKLPHMLISVALMPLIVGCRESHIVEIELLSIRDIILHRTLCRRGFDRSKAVRRSNGRWCGGSTREGSVLHEP
jgi:hypothetical protein